MRIKVATAVWRKQGSKIETTACIIAKDKPQTSYRDLEKWRFPSIGGVYEFTCYFVKITETPYITLKLYRYYGKNMNKFLTKFKQIVDKRDRIVIEYWDCIGSDRSSRDSGSANNSHYLNLTHSLCSLSPPLSRCFLASNTIKSKVQRRTRYEPDRRVLCNRLPCFKHNQIKSAKAHPIRTRSQGPFLLCGKYRLWYFRNHDKSPLQSSTHECASCTHRNLRFRAAHFCPLFQYHTISLHACRKALFVTAFLKKDKSICFPFRRLSKNVEKFLFIVPYYPLHFLLVCFRIVLQNLYER